MINMSRETDDYDLLEKFTIQFSNIIEKYTPYIIVSGYFAISSGRARGTEDIDMIIRKCSYEIFEKLHLELSEKFSCLQGENAEEIYEYLIEGASIRYTYHNSEIPEMEIKFSKDILDDEQLKTRQKYELTGIDVFFCEINSQIAFKEEYLRAQKDIEDAKHLRIVYEEFIDEELINNWKQKIKEVKL